MLQRNHNIGSEKLVCLFIMNLLCSTGFGAAIAITSNDTAIDGSTNRPNGTLILRNTLVQGRDCVVTTVAQTAGGLNVAGDKNGGTALPAFKSSDPPPPTVPRLRLKTWDSSIVM